MDERLTALVTGASAGIGKAFADVFGKYGFNLILTARREDRLNQIATEFSAKHRVQAHVIPADLVDPAAPERLVNEIKARGLRVDALINNAGFGIPGRYVATKWENQRDFIQVLVTAPCELAHRLAPAMAERKRGYIINVASLAGMLPGSAGATLYGASKSFMVQFSRSLNIELEKDGVHVTAVCPGFTYSEFHDVNNTREMVSQMPKWMWLDADRVAREGYRAVMRGRFVHVPGLVYRTMVFFVRHLPESWVLRATLSQSRKFRRQ
jgi:hypothetical protein